QDGPEVAALDGPHRRAASPLPRAAYHELDFWVGEWDVASAAGQRVGSSRIERILDGCVIEENYSGRLGDTGRSYNLYDAPRDRWQQTWVSDRGLLLEYHDRLVDGAMRYTADPPAGQDSPTGASGSSRCRTAACASWRSRAPTAARRGRRRTTPSKRRCPPRHSSEGHPRRLRPHLFSRALDSFAEALFARGGPPRRMPAWTRQRLHLQRRGRRPLIAPSEGRFALLGGRQGRAKLLPIFSSCT